MSQSENNALVCGRGSRIYLILTIIVLSVPLWLNLVFPSTGIGLIISVFLFIVTTLSAVQSFLFLYASIYAWIEPKRVIKNSAPKNFIRPELTFSVLLPARHEEKVIADTIKAISRANYPEEKLEVLIIVRNDDINTIKEAEKAIKEIDRKNFRLIIFDGYPINKPRGLNIALHEANNDVLVIFDAEDEPNQEIFNIVNTVMFRDNSKVVQAGVQLINYRSSWFSTLNVLEYFFWFKSALHFFNFLGVTPLGGNTVFFKKSMIEKIGGWDENALTEDAEIGLNLSQNNTKISIVYDSKYITKEETPPTLSGFIKQRTRWNQGFLQILLKGKWANISGICRKTFSFYLLAWPEIQALYFIYVPFSVFSIFFLKLPIWLALYSTLPMFLFILMFIVLNVGLYEFTSEYKLKYKWYFPLKMIITFFPYQFLLGISAVRAVLRLLIGNISWEKTAHINQHRTLKLQKQYQEAS